MAGGGVRVVEMPGRYGRWRAARVGLAGVWSCGGRKDDVRQRISRKDLTESRIPVNLGNKMLV